MHIAVCGELGSGCTEVGGILSEKLGIRCINSSDVIRSIVSNFRESFEEFESNVLSGEVNLDVMINGKISEFLEMGDLIVEGRSAFLLLDREDIFKVLLVAPRTKRIEHIAKRRGITNEESEKDLDESDMERGHMVKKTFKKDWLDPHNYDMVINTGPRTYKEVADLIIKTIPER